MPIPTDITLESAERRLEGEDKRLFLKFMRKLLQWRPEDRPDCDGVFHDKWLLAEMIEAGRVEWDEENERMKGD